MNADELVNRWLVQNFQTKRDLGLMTIYDHRRGDVEHMKTCPEVQVATVESNLELLWDTGVESMKFDARLRCVHGQEAGFEVNVFGDSLTDVIADLDAVRDQL